jgi:hypothetical protein
VEIEEEGLHAEDDELWTGGCSEMCDSSFITTKTVVPGELHKAQQHSIDQ